jgi:SOS response regulatory protein OraA/RecX
MADAHITHAEPQHVAKLGLCMYLLSQRKILNKQIIKQIYKEIFSNKITEYTVDRKKAEGGGGHWVETEVTQGWGELK